MAGFTRIQLVFLSVLLVTGLTLFAHPAIAVNSCDATPAKGVFSRAFFDPRIYRIADCQANVLRLLQQLQSHQVALSDAKVLYIFNTKALLESLDRDALNWLHPKNPKLGIGRISPPWLFHVNLLIGDTVLDLDFGHWPRLVEVNLYFNEMFSEQSDFYVRSIPAADYLNDYLIADENHDWRYYLLNGEARYPAQRLSDFLRSFESYSCAL